MATTYTVYIFFLPGKGAEATWRYPDTTTQTGVGHTSGNPLQVNAGDNVKFVEVSGSSGGGTITGLSLFTDNSNVPYNALDGIGEIADRTVASGTTPSSVNTITATNTVITTATDDFFIQRVAPPADPPTIEYVYHTQDDSSTVNTFVILSDQGSGGTGLKYAQTTGTSVPSTGWQTSNQFTQLRGTTRYYWASRDEDTAGEFDGPESYIIPSENPNLPSVTGINYGIKIANADGVVTFTNRRRSLVMVYNASVTLAAQATTTINNIDDANNTRVTFVNITNIFNYQSSGTGGEVRVTTRTATSITLQNTDTVNSRTVRVQIFRQA